MQQTRLAQDGCRLPRPPPSAIAAPPRTPAPLPRRGPAAFAASSAWAGALPPARRWPRRAARSTRPAPAPGAPAPAACGSPPSPAAAAPSRTPTAARLRPGPGTARLQTAKARARAPTARFAAATRCRCARAARRTRRRPVWWPSCPRLCGLRGGGRDASSLSHGESPPQPRAPPAKRRWSARSPRRTARRQRAFPAPGCLPRRSAERRPAKWARSTSPSAPGGGRTHRERRRVNCRRPRSRPPRSAPGPAAAGGSWRALCCACPCREPERAPAQPCPPAPGAAGAGQPARHQAPGRQSSPPGRGPGPLGLVGAPWLAPRPPLHLSPPPPRRCRPTPRRRPACRTRSARLPLPPQTWRVSRRPRPAHRPPCLPGAQALRQALCARRERPCRPGSAAAARHPADLGLPRRPRHRCPRRRTSPRRRGAAQSLPRQTRLQRGQPRQAGCGPRWPRPPLA
mmetsp:Transcript_23102/g.87391  ORF Transcript_23102/g.87391 Transcript_23102/m.87391 type:complete len:456 (-) Transcript_23102:2411-3778(-)